MNTRTIKTACGKVAMLAMAGTLALGAGASSVTIDSVSQRWPWNNKVDIKYTIDGGQTLTADGTGDVYCRLEFTATVNGQNVLIDGRAIGANASNGTHTATWTPSPELRVKALDCTMTARLLSADNPSGDDYMVIDLDTGSVTYEGLLYSQDLSNARYNTDTYKTDKMVLRKVPRWADRASLPNAASLPATGYQTGLSALNHSTPTNWVTKLDYYIGVFPVTQAQYVKFGQSNPSVCTDAIGNHPVESVCYDDLRGGTRAGTALTEVDSTDSGSVLQRLNCKTGNTFAFDLPTEVMYEIACRAGQTGKYYWGDDATVFSTYVVYNTSSTAATGSKTPNDWGLYDVVGNVYEWCLDDSNNNNGSPDLATLDNPFTPYVNADWTRARIRGIKYSESTNTKYIQSSYRNYGTRSSFKDGTGFRVAYIAK